MHAPSSIRNHLVKPGHIVGLKFSDGWWFIQSIGMEYNEVKPWTLLNENDSRGELGAGESGQDDQNIVDDSGGNKILEPNDDDRNTVHQIFYGVSPSRMQVFNLFGRNRNEAIEDYDSPGEAGVYTTGYDSPYNNPSPETEVFYVNSMSPLRLQPYNPMDEAAEASISFHVNKIRYTTITSESKQKAILQNQEPGKLVMAGKGIQDADQAGIPSWLSEAFGEHIRSTEEILDSSQDGTEGNVAVGQRGALERGQ